jgi:hypothetical protein
VENGTGSCVDGECRIGDCDQDWENCNTDAFRAGYDDGCESNLLTSRTNCGSCGTECLEIGGANACSTGMCVPECDATHGNCDGDPNDGCETAITGAGNEAHCGNCTTECTTAGATITTCSGSGLCIPSCDATHLSCDTGAPGGANGCESDVNAPSSCGRCGATCDGDTPNCVQTGDARTCQAGIVLANDVDGSTPSAVLNLTHALQSGSNRLILIAVAAEVGGGDPVPSRPDVVTYGGTAMTAGPEQSGGTNFWSPDLFVYYVTENELVGKSGSQAVVIDGSPGTGDPGAIIANLVQFNGVRQTTPLSATSGRILDGQTTPNPDTITSAVTVSTAGSRIYSFNAGTFTYSPSVAVTSSPMLTHMLGSTGIEVMSPVAMRVMGLYVGGGSPNSLAPGSYDVSWTYAAANELTHLAVVIHPAQGL